MRVKTTKHLNGWYGITANEGDEFDVPENLRKKAEAMSFLQPVRKKKNAEDIE